MSMETYGLACVQIRLRKLALLSVGFGAFALFSSCSNEVALENQRQLQMQKAELEEMHRELEALRSQIAGQSSAPPANSQSGPMPASATGACDVQIANKALAHGAERMSRGDYKSAVDYYRDAVAACPDRADAEFKLGQAYEAMGQNGFAREHYRRAEILATQSDPGLAQQARQALARIAAQ